MKLSLFLTISLPFLCAAGAEAQSSKAQPAPLSGGSARRFRILVNGGFNTASRSFGTVTSFVQFLEEGSSSRNYDGSSGFVFELGAIYSLTPAIGVLGSFELFSGDNDAVFEKTVPHPLLFNHDRSVRGDLAGMSYDERALHVDVVYTVERPLFTIDFFGGPTFFFTDTELITDIGTRSVYPFDDIELGTTSSGKFTENPVGFNAGAALTYRLTPVFGVSFQGRFSRATVNLEQGGESLDFDAGGFRIGAGIRLAF